MGIKSFIGHLFGTGSNGEVQRPASLGEERSSQANVSNLGGIITDDTEEVPNHVASSSEEKGSEPEAKETKGNDVPEEKKKAATYNLIILDESGSMGCVRSQTISGCNETLTTIRHAANEHPDIQQFVSIFSFDTAHSRYLFKNVPVENTRDLTEDDYCPNSCTPLYDAIGYTVSQLRKVAIEADSVGLVTIITDGYENASRKWSHHAIVALIEELKKQGWVFTFIGANIDVEKTATGLGINSFMEFEQSEDGMAAMFNMAESSRRAYYARQQCVRASAVYDSMVEDARRELLGAMNKNYFVEENRIAPDVITTLNKNEIFVFGSNVMGAHTGGASKYAVDHFGAIMGQAEGFQGQSYAIPTVGNSFEELQVAVLRFTEFAAMHPQYKFMLTEVGCGNAGYQVAQIASLFMKAYSFGNVYVPKSFLRYVEKGNLDF